ncbi:hypothetical protein SERLA73DRAFT_91017 [Serpula lacrymans var. lacrymans S7.3]|uniref:F-box domain-containing protein n=2 Tax=Serpula lacrymans var. lacrymans TaxID=341189 RepID=F8Q0Q2_SERL3|nr:uncharacterized protein SERLADRAFT_356432 [Serpula lacrymans var. lacrymans S7.9]EGN97881.1 hypothetical protein SERLA73DRAFT_91017 [Serpula lacrymans var. lacrymans S7.3]EGO23460.1 hypothetical protein SERLADRAFT_356432 [Serpula lacrymans var. lacrymans S7.9]
MPLFFSRVRICTLTSLDMFTSRLQNADKKWDSICRIPYSTPGRWVQVLDLACLPKFEAFVIDSLLTQLFPLLPFLTRLSINPTMSMSRRALAALALRDGCQNLRVLEGISYDPSFNSSITTSNDPLVQLLHSCPNLEQLEMFGLGLDPADIDSTSDAESGMQTICNLSLHLGQLHTLALLSMPSSSLLWALINTSLPSLRKVTVTPYDDIPYPISLVSRFIQVHGLLLHSLSFFTPKLWPTLLHTSPSTIFHSAPNLRHLSLECPLPMLTVPHDSDSSSPSLCLKILSIPRPNSDSWRILERLLPHLPHLVAVRVRDVRWLRRGMTPRAQEAGVQGEMRGWRRRLARRGINLLDGDWKETD